MPVGVRLLKLAVCIAGALLFTLAVVKDAAERPVRVALRQSVPLPQTETRQAPSSGADRSTADARHQDLLRAAAARLSGADHVSSTSFAEGGYLISATPTEISDVFVSLKTSGKFHKSRLGLLLETWIPMAMESVTVFTDVDDPELAYEAPGLKVIDTHCPTGHSRQHLSCKFGVELDTYLESNKRWFCHVDDDNYLNVHNLVTMLRKYNHEEQWYLGKSSLGHPLEIMDPIEKDHNVALWFATGGAGLCLTQALAKRIKPYVGGGRFSYWSDLLHLPDDCTLGYIVGHLMQLKLTEVPGLHSHLEGLWALNDDNIGEQITFSYGYFEDRDRRRTSNVVSVIGSSKFNITNDNTRLRTSHCLMFPETQQCDKYRIVSSDDRMLNL